MPLKITSPEKQVGVLNKWADMIEARLHTHDNRILSVAKTSAATSSGGGGGVTSVGFTGPKEATITGSPVTSSGTINWAWAPENPGDIFQAPGPGLSGYQGSGYGFVNNDVGQNNALSVTFTPTSSQSLAFLAAEGNSNPNISSAGWTAVSNSSTEFYWKAISGTNPVTASYTSLGQQSVVIGSMCVFTGPVTHVQDNTTVSNPSGIAMTHTAGDTIFVGVRLNTFNPAVAASITLSDTLGNVYQQLVNDFHSGHSGGVTVGCQIAVFVCVNCIGGANTINATSSGPLSGSPTTVVAEFGPLPPGSGVPFFAPISGSLIPAINLSATGNGGVGGILPVARGGTGVTSSTGTVNTVLSASPTFSGTVTLPIVSQTGLTTRYNNIVTVSNGIPSEYATVDSTAQSAAISTTTLYAVPSTGAGQYRVSWNAKITTPGTTDTLGPLTITYTDPDNVVQTITCAAQSNAGVIETSDSGTTTTTVLLGLPLLLNCKASTNIQYAFAYASTGTSMQYNLHIKLEAL